MRFDNDYFSNLALTDNFDSFNLAVNSKNSKTPELTNIGSFKKCRKLINGKWWMYKKAAYDEMFSELFIYQLGVELGFNMASISRGYPKNIGRKNDLLINLFNELLKYDNNLKQYILLLSEEIIAKVIKMVGMRVKGNYITEFIMNGYRKINI